MPRAQRHVNRIRRVNFRKFRLIRIIWTHASNTRSRVLFDRQTYREYTASAIDCFRANGQ